MSNQDVSGGVYFTKRKAPAKKATQKEPAKRLKKAKAPVVFHQSKLTAPLRALSLGPEGLPTVEELMANPRLLVKASEPVQKQLLAKIQGRSAEEAQGRYAQAILPRQLEGLRQEQVQGRLEARANTQDALDHLNMLRQSVRDTGPQLANYLAPRLDALEQLLANVQTHPAPLAVNDLSSYAGVFADVNRPTGAEMQGLTKQALAGYARARGMTGYSALSKGMLINKIENETPTGIVASGLKTKGGKFALPTGTNPTGTPVGGDLSGYAVRTHGRYVAPPTIDGVVHGGGVMDFLKMPSLAIDFLDKIKKGLDGGALSDADTKAIQQQAHGVHGGGFLGDLLKGVARVALPALLPMATPFLGPLAPIAGAVLPHLLGGGLADNLTIAKRKKHLKTFVDLLQRSQGGALNDDEKKKLDAYTGGGLFGDIFKTIAKVALPALLPAVAPMLGPLAPIAGAVLPHLLGGKLKGKHVQEVQNGVNIKKHFKKFMSLARTIQKGGTLSPAMNKKFNDYRQLNAGGFFGDAWNSIKRGASWAGNKIMDNLPAIIEHAPKAIELVKGLMK
ncbi:MAG: hypothetical protein EBW68_00765 [Actinobacteria bacterium]|nr:hypothetical protein [Actinomycetota bacterium]